MKSILTVVCALMVSYFACSASEASSTATMPAETNTSYSTSVPTGNYYYDNDFIMIRDTWVRIVISGSGKEYEIAQCERDYDNNYAITLTDNNGNRASITVYSNKSALYYNGCKYVKR